MAQLELDHLVIGAASLDQGVAWLERQTGIVPPPGGAHPRMGTHNHVTAFGPSSYLEVIAVDPVAPPPSVPRWFALDDPDERASLERCPRPLTWVARTTDIEASLAAARAVGLDLGRPVGMSRGDLAWRISLRDDGGLPEGGTLPALIEWPPGPHPAGRMADQGLRLETLELHHPEPERLVGLLDALGAGRLAACVLDDAPAVRAIVRTAEGAHVTLGDAGA